MSRNRAKVSSGQPRGLTHPAFVIISAILLASAIAFNGFVWNLKLHFKKEAVAQPRDFRELPPLMGHWLQVSQDDKLDKETEDVLGTESYIYRDYVQVDRAGADLVALVATGVDWNAAATQPSLPDTLPQQASDAARTKFNSASFDRQVRMINDALQGKTPGERKSIVSVLEVRNHWGDVIHLGLTYYTGLVDTVAHIPDRCYIADGYEPSSYTVPFWQLGTDASGKPFSQSVRFISFQDSTGNNRVSKCVAYLFHTNGHYESDPLGVRQTLEDLTERYGYYAKIELMTLVPNIDETDISNASAAMTDFLKAARPQIETCFPDWTKVNHSHS